MEKRWVQAVPGNKETIDLLAQELNIARSLAEILAQRGINSFQEAKDFFRPQLSQLHDPYLMKDMDKAIHRIDAALAAGEQIMI